MRRYPFKYFVPNAITCASLTLGIISVLHAMGGSYEVAGWLIVMSVLLDKLDGTAARLLKASSEFGVQLDSFSDFITFGVAPGFLLYALLTNPTYGAPYFLDRPVYFWGVRVIVVFYILMACLRLAKFNVLTETIGSSHFLGLPTTLSGALIATYVLTAIEHAWPPVAFHVLPLIYLVLGVLMVSELPMPKVAMPNNPIGRLALIASLAMAYVFGFLWIFPGALLGLALLFAIFGIIYGALYLRGKPLPEEAIPDDEGEGSENPA